MNQTKNKFHYAWWILTGLILVVGLSKAGIMNTGGLFLTPVTEDLGMGMGSLTIYFSISSIVTMLFLPIAGKLMAKYDIRLILIVSIILQGGAFAMFGLMNSVWGWYLFSIPMAMGSVFTGQMVGPVLINNWFKKSKGLAMGILVAAGGLFGAILQPAAGNLIASEGWRNTYFILGIGVMVIVIPVVLLAIRMSPKQKGLEPYGSDEVNPNEKKSAQPVSNIGVTAAVAKKSSSFYLLVMFFFLLTSIASFSQHVGPFAMTHGFDIKFAGNAMGFWSVGIVIGALVLGYLSDKIGVRNTAMAAMILGIVPTGILIMVPGNAMMFSIAIGILGFVVASLGTLGPVLTTALFGNKEYGQIYALAAVGLAVAGIVALPGYGFVYQLTGSYTTVLYAVVVMFVLNAVAIFFAFKKKLDHTA